MIKTITKATKIKPFQTSNKPSAPNPKLAKILSNACPEVILANNRTAKLITREKLEINSIKIIKGVITKGEPWGKKWLNIMILLVTNEWSQIINIVKLDKTKVNNSWLVIVCVYGIKPAKLQLKIIEKNKVTKSA